MTPEIALSLTKKENQSLSEWIKSAKEVYESNVDDIIGFPYSNGDIAYLRFTEEANLSDREMDMVYISNFFNQAYVTLHLTIRTLRGHVSPSDIKILTTTYDILESYNLEHCLLEGLTKKQYQKYIKEYDG